MRSKNAHVTCRDLCQSLIGATILQTTTTTTMAADSYEVVAVSFSTMIALARYELVFIDHFYRWSESSRSSGAVRADDARGGTAVPCLRAVGSYVLLRVLFYHVSVFTRAVTLESVHLRLLREARGKAGWLPSGFRAKHPKRLSRCSRRDSTSDRGRIETASTFDTRFRTLVVRERPLGCFVPCRLCFYRGL